MTGFLLNGFGLNGFMSLVIILNFSCCWISPGVNGAVRFLGKLLMTGMPIQLVPTTLLVNDF